MAASARGHANQRRHELVSILSHLERWLLAGGIDAIHAQLVFQSSATSKDGC